MKKGLTLVELVIVLAVLAIIGAILVPNFLSTTDKARLKSDIQSARVIQNAMDLYRSEQGEEVEGGNNVEQVLLNLSNNGYLKEDSLTIQTAGASWAVDASIGIVVNIASVDDKESVNAAYQQLTDLEKPYVIGVSYVSSAEPEIE